MAKETVQVAQYAASFRYDDFPSDVVERAKQCITDTIATIIFGYDLPWSRMIVAFAEKNGAGGKSRILGPGGARCMRHRRRWPTARWRMPSRWTI